MTDLSRRRVGILLGASANADGTKRTIVNTTIHTIAHTGSVTILPTPTENMSMSTTSFRFPGVLNSQELLVAEAIQARALASLDAQGLLAGTDTEAAKAKLGGIVLRLMSDHTKSIDDLSAAAIASFKRI
ncbi:MAG: hypothetical protein DI537_35400 [Stutzerimonas stutzeri]|nr:MAG: hypothetical protein DI537_35400 [Stutzerimonas stutzeri]